MNTNSKRSVLLTTKVVQKKKLLSRYKLNLDNIIQTNGHTSGMQVSNSRFHTYKFGYPESQSLGMRHLSAYKRIL